jgi:hypothetical protein
MERDDGKAEESGKLNNGKWAIAEVKFEGELRRKLLTSRGQSGVR